MRVSPRLVRLLKSLDIYGLPRNDFVLCGSAAMTFRGGRMMKDLDVLVLPKHQEHITKRGAKEKEGGEHPYWDASDISKARWVARDFGWQIDFFSTLQRIPSLTTAAWNSAELIDGYWVLGLDYCVTVKELAKRPSDRNDIKWIHAELEKPKYERKQRTGW